ncbi:hypothetical protein F5Y16DRAFT_416580 [Xylariaceae sp. FL0255]|nr:hypothetical protein F5Y16DRAFT_416580 [Xylariaceae sp. FL0255]
MEFTNPIATSQQGKSRLRSGTGMKTDIGPEVNITPFPTRKPSLRTNFSYPRLSRHESSESRSSTGSVPGMTDTSDSDQSFDDDCVYNTTAGQLWDSFWPDGGTPSPLSEQYPAIVHTAVTRDYFSVNPTRRRSSSHDDDDTIRVSPRESGPAKADDSPPQGQQERRPSPRPTPKRAPATYSVYPKPTVMPNIQRIPHPPRTSSLGFEPPSPPRRQLFLRSSKSSVALKSSKSNHSVASALFIVPPAPSGYQETLKASSSSTGIASVPVSPANAPPTLPGTLRASTSSFTLRDKSKSSKTRLNSNTTSHNVTAPLTPLLPSTMPPPPLPSSASAPFPPPQPQFERYVSVFELDDSDTEDSGADESSSSSGNNFARLIARGLHRKSASEKRGGVVERKAVAAGFLAPPATGTNADVGIAANGLVGSENGDLSPEHRDKSSQDLGSLGRKRGGSLGRIFGLMSR